MGSICDTPETERLIDGIVGLVKSELPDLRPVDLGLLIEIFLVLKCGSHDARDSLLRHLDTMRRAFPGGERDGGPV